MKKTKLELTIYGIPRTKKNSQIPAVNKKTGRPMIIQSKIYRDYEKDAVKQIEDLHKTWHIDYLCNCQYVYYRPTKIRVDQSNLMAATDDILVKAGVLEDDNWKIIGGHDGTRVRFDPENPRVEITITEMKDES